MGDPRFGAMICGALFTAWAIWLVIEPVVIWYWPQ